MNSYFKFSFALLHIFVIIAQAQVDPEAKEILDNYIHPHVVEDSDFPFELFDTMVHIASLRQYSRDGEITAEVVSAIDRSNKRIAEMSTIARKYKDGGYNTHEHMIYQDSALTRVSIFAGQPSYNYQEVEEDSLTYINKYVKDRFRNNSLIRIPEYVSAKYEGNQRYDTLLEGLQIRVRIEPELDLQKFIDPYEVLFIFSPDFTLIGRVLERKDGKHIKVLEKPIMTANGITEYRTTEYILREGADVVLASEAIARYGPFDFPLDPALFELPEPASD